MNNVKDFGAYADGVHDDTRAIQKALDAGGQALLPPGRYLSGTLYLRSNGGLHLEAGAELISGNSDNVQWNDKTFWPENRYDSSEMSNGRHLIVARECENISITGLGKIDGQYWNWIGDTTEPNGFFTLHPRNGQLIFLCRCKGIRIKDVTLCNGSYWHCFLLGCEDAIISGIRVYGERRVLCNDGIDLDCCKNVTVSDCIIDTGDDAITLRGDSSALGEAKVCEFITVTNCVLCSRFADGVRLGVGSTPIRNSVFSNLVIYGSDIGIEATCNYSGTHDGGTDIENVRFENIQMDTLRAFKIQLNTSYSKIQSKATISNVTFSHISGRVQLTSQILGNDKGVLRGITMNDLDLEYSGKGPAPWLDETGKWGRDSSDAAFDITCADDITFRSCAFRWTGDYQDNWKHGLNAVSCNNIRIIDCDFGRDNCID